MRKEIVIDGTASDWFDKATFVLKESSNHEIPKNLMGYAEEIIENHMKKFPDVHAKSLPSVDFTHSKKVKREEVVQSYQKQMNGKDKFYPSSRELESIIRAQKQLKKEYEKLKREKEAIRKRAKHVNTFITLAIIACILCFTALALICV